MKVAIVGSRKASDELLMRCWEYVESLSLDTIIISGGAVGIDEQAENCAFVRGMKTIILKPDWKQYGKAAGMIRNQHIVDMADEIAAFWDGKSKGTQNTIQRAQRAGKKVTIFEA